VARSNPNEKEDVMSNMREAMPMLTWAVDMAAPFALGTSFLYSIKLGAPIGNPLNGEAWFGEISSLSVDKPITGLAGVTFDAASNCWLPLSVVFCYQDRNYAVFFTCALKVRRIMVITMTLGDGEEEA
jgi:hypothetical protein